MQLKYRNTLISEDQASDYLGKFLAELTDLQDRYKLYLEQEYDWVFVTDRKPTSSFEAFLRLHLRDEENFSVMVYPKKDEQ